MKLPPTPPGVKTAWADPEHMRLVRGLIEGWTDRPELVTRQQGQELDDPWHVSAALVPLGRCPVCVQPVPGYTDRRYMLCRVKLGFHFHPRWPGVPCIGSSSLGRPWEAA